MHASEFGRLAVRLLAIYFVVEGLATVGNTIGNIYASQQLMPGADGIVRVILPLAAGALIQLLAGITLWLGADRLARRFGSVGASAAASGERWRIESFVIAAAGLVILILAGTSLVQALLSLVWRMEDVNVSASAHGPHLIAEALRMLLGAWLIRMAPRLAARLGN
ncbi:hypothetical protein IDH44_12840 [Paenibacillus sp. IB182496]|uniref:Uncharacterized protein n=1 Tax=Paenibacillus sabuli TaxID=2772509 RepID=A0A927BV75_9BACL|nr:hypothetical protein [Paenibacillus sabuli]MBD2846084.1 hypothetical protein [Paenibacillus sabuli]